MLYSKRICRPENALRLASNAILRKTFKFTKSMLLIVGSAKGKKYKTQIAVKAHSVLA